MPKTWLADKEERVNAINQQQKYEMPNIFEKIRLIDKEKKGTWQGAAAAAGCPDQFKLLGKTSDQICEKLRSDLWTNFQSDLWKTQ